MRENCWSAFARVSIGRSFRRIRRGDFDADGGNVNAGPQGPPPDLRRFNRK
jgi:hypothetical protein